jgi:ABC-type glycerol-3-phosphate transport system substrate-binding protein
VQTLNLRVQEASRHLAALIDIASASASITEFVIDGPLRALGVALVDATQISLRERKPARADIPIVRFSSLGADGVVLGAATHAFRKRLGVSWTTENLTHTFRDTSLSLVEQTIGGYSMTRMPIVRKYVSAAAVAALTLGVVGCASDSGGADTITLEVWTHEFEPLQQVLTEKWIPEFEAANEGIEIKLTSIPFAGAVSYDAKLIAALSSGGGPDVWDMGDWNYKTFAENGYLEPIDPTAFGFADDQELIDSFLPGSTDALISDGKLLGLFSEFNTLNLFYNNEVFADAGIDPLPADKPVSWEQIGEIGEKLRVENGAALERIGLQLGFFANFRSPQWYAQTYYTFLRQYGQDDIFVDGAPAADTEAAIKAFQLLYDLTFTYEAYDPNFLNNWFADVPQGRAGMVSAGTWYPASAIQNNEDFDFSVAPQPVVDPDDPDTYKNVSWLWGWSINANADEARKAASQKFLAFMLGKKGETEQAADWFERLGYMQPSKAFLESDAYNAALAESPWLNLWVEALANYEVRAVPHSYDEAGAALVRAMDRVVYDGASAEEAAAQLQSELERLAG